MNKCYFAFSPYWTGRRRYFILSDKTILQELCPFEHVRFENVIKMCVCVCVGVCVQKYIHL